MLTTLMLSRMQFAFTITFHILFPAFSIGLATFLMIMEAVWLKTKNPLYYNICRFWIKVFAITFGMGVVSGIVMEFQLGTNWAGFTRLVGPVLGSLFTYEVLTAFFIEAGFLGVMLFGWDKVGKKLHFCATFLVWFGVTLSAFWILSANSWMQTPAGASINKGVFVVNNWWHVIFNPSFLPRYFHMLMASYLSALFVISAIAAYYLLKKRHTEFAKTCFSFALWGIVILIPVQIVMGDKVGLDVHQYQPIKTAAIEGNWHTQRGAPLLLFAIPEQREQKNIYSISIPHMASLINTHEWNGELQGLTSVKPADQPYVSIVFFSFRVMVALGLLMLLIGLIGLWLRYKKTLYRSEWFLKLCMCCAPIGFISMITGWFTAEAGRQPWVVYDLVRTSDAVSKVDVKDVVISFVLLFLVYGVIFGVFYFRYLFKVIGKGPAELENKQEQKQPFGYMQGGK
jgi:cytochrome d ubiquinol oxidase subunit I